MQAQYHGPSFRAIDGHGGDHTLTPVYRVAAGSDGHDQPSYAAADCVGLVTADGRSVTRLAKGRYLLGNPDPARQVTLFSDDPHAP